MGRLSWTSCPAEFHAGGMESRAVTFVIYDGFDGLDLAGPFEVFGQAGYELTLVAPKAGPVLSDMGLTIHAQSSRADVPPRLHLAATRATPTRCPTTSKSALVGGSITRGPAR
jgi:hypothetical protein